MSTPLETFEPHPVLAPHYGSKPEKDRFLRGIFDRSAPHYEGIASWGFFGSGHWYRVQALRERSGLKPGMKCLDLAAGTGPTARAVAEVAVTGSLESGKFADLIVLDRNPLTIPAEDIANTKVLETVAGGKVVYQRGK